MHELGVVIEVVKTLERVVKENDLKEVETIVLQIGEISSMMPKYIEDCFDVAVDGTQFEKTQLKIEILTATALCRPCQKVFRLVENDGLCKCCKGNDWELLSGKEFLIKEIVAC
ncbi:MAG TPA: hydrogenase maturation nickel metallochaperone HypA [Erysipelotrichaceae bacterium]|nr:hydrogenase maturation nickel metallochaperone HypA [Erysipelotrichaceae bacterium]